MKARHSASPSRPLATLFLAAALVVGGTTGKAQLLDVFRDWTGEEISDILDRVRSARDKAAAIRGRTEGVKDVVETARENFTALSGNVLDAVDDARDTAGTLLGEEMSRARNFSGGANCGAGSTCDEFRNDLLTLLDDMSDIYSTLLQIDAAAVQPGIEVDLPLVRAAVQTIPGLALYPVYRAMTEGGDLFGSGLLELTARAREDLDFARTALASNGSAATAPTTRVEASIIPGLDATSIAAFNSCDIFIATPDQVRRTSLNLVSTAIVLKVVGKALDGAGETLVLGGPKEVGVHGYFKINFHDNKKKQLGGLFDLAADLLGLVSSALDYRLVRCAAVAERYHVLQALWGNHNPPPPTSRPPPRPSTRPDRPTGDLPPWPGSRRG